MRNKKNACAYIGIGSESYELPEETSEEELLALIAELNHKEEVRGILVQLPLPAHINEEKVILAIDPAKDVDGFHPQSAGALMIGSKGFLPCTPAGVIQLLKRSDIEIEGKNCVVRRKKQYRGKTDGYADAAGKCNGDSGSFQNKRFEGTVQTGRYPDCCDWKTQIYYTKSISKKARQSLMWAFIVWKGKNYAATWILRLLSRM